MKSIAQCATAEWMWVQSVITLHCSIHWKSHSPSSMSQPHPPELANSKCHSHRQWLNDMGGKEDDCHCAVTICCESRYLSCLLFSPDRNSTGITNRIGVNKIVSIPDFCNGWVNFLLHWMMHNKCKLTNASKNPLQRKDVVEQHHCMRLQSRLVGKLWPGVWPVVFFKFGLSNTGSKLSKL